MKLKKNESCYIALGSNQEDPIQHVTQASQKISKLPDICFIQTSSLYRTEPEGNQEQPNFINAVIEVITTYSPTILLKQLFMIENQHGRYRKNQRNLPRTLDLDILLYGDQTMNTSDLTIPHPRMWHRQFVLQPLLEIAPHFYKKITEGQINQKTSLQVKKL